MDNTRKRIRLRGKYHTINKAKSPFVVCVENNKRNTHNISAVQLVGEDKHKKQSYFNILKIPTKCIEFEMKTSKSNNGKNMRTCISYKDLLENNKGKKTECKKIYRSCSTVSKYILKSNNHNRNSFLNFPSKIEPSSVKKIINDCIFKRIYRFYKKV